MYSTIASKGMQVAQVLTKSLRRFRIVSSWVFCNVDCSSVLKPVVMGFQWTSTLDLNGGAVHNAHNIIVYRLYQTGNKIAEN